MKSLGNAIWGIILVAIGVIFALNALGIANINIFFRGWWTLFIIVPSFIGVLKESDKTGSLIGLAIGIVLLLCANGILLFSLVWKLLFPAILIFFGLSMIFKDSIQKNVKEKVKDLNGKLNHDDEYCSTFSSQKIHFDNETFRGADLTAVFGSVDCDVRNSIFNEDVVINATSIFGGITIYVPAGMSVKVRSTAIFGGVGGANRYRNNNSQYVIYVNATCLFGGVDIK